MKYGPSVYLHQLRVPLLGDLLFFDGQFTLAHGNCQVGSALENFQFTSHRAPGLCDLNSCCASADDGTLLAFDVDLIIRPEGGMMDNAFEIVNSWPVRDISFRSEASTNDKILGLSIPAVGSLNVPASLICVELSFSDNR